jgi:hypothetical protein
VNLLGTVWRASEKMLSLEAGKNSRPAKILNVTKELESDSVPKSSRSTDELR